MAHMKLELVPRKISRHTGNQGPEHSYAQSMQRTRPEIQKMFG